MGHSGDLSPTTASLHPNQKVFISRLINSVFFSISTCFIMTRTNQKEYRLLAFQGKKVLADSNYQTLRGARIAFRKKFKDHSWSDAVLPEWSHCYRVNRDWIDKFLTIAGNV